MNFGGKGINSAVKTKTQSGVKTTDVLFVTHVVGSRKPFALRLLKANKVFIVTWPGTCTDPKRQVPFFDEDRHVILDIGSPEDLGIGRQNVIDYARDHDIRRFWMADDDIHTIRKVDPHAGSIHAIRSGFDVSEIDFEEDCGLGGLASAGCMFKTWQGAKFAKRLVWGMVMIDLDYFGSAKYNPGGWEDVDLQLQFIRDGLKFQTTNYYGFGKEVARGGKKSLANPTDKILHRAYHLYGLHGDNLKFDMKDFHVIPGSITSGDLGPIDPKTGLQEIYLPWPHIVLPVPKTGYKYPPYRYRTDTFDHWYEDLEKDRREYPDRFGKFGIPHMKGVSHTKTR